MKELQPTEKRTRKIKEKSREHRRNKPEKVVTPVRAKAPTAKSCEILILCVLSRRAQDGMRTKDVLQEVNSKNWFSKLDDDDRRARYPSSRKKIVDSVIKYARKNLVMKGEIYPVGGERPIGDWKITAKGFDRVLDGRGLSTPAYSTHDAIIIEEEKK